MNLRTSLIILAVWLGLGCAEGRKVPDSGACSASPAALDFGEVEIGSVVSASLSVTNSDKARVVVSEPMDPPFSSGQSREFPLSGPNTSLFSINFAPQDALLHLTEFRLTDRDTDAGTACEVTVPVRGLGAGVVAANPSSLDFGFLDPGQSRTIELRLENSRREEVSVNIFLDGPLNAPFTLDLPPPTVMPARSSSVVSITASPTSLASLNTGQLIISPSKGTLVAVPLRFTVGVPIAEFSPLAELPRVGFSQDSQPPSFADRILEVRNVGTTGLFNEAVLHLDEAVPFTVEALDGGVAEELSVVVLFGELCVGAFGTVVLTLQPRSVGPRLYRITFHTNEPADRVVMLQTVVEVLPPCFMEVSPSELRLARTPDGGASGTVTFTNTGPETCFIDDLRLSPGGHEPYSIVGGAPSQVAVPADAGYVVTIAGPRGDATFSSALLTFHVLGPNSIRAQREVFTTP